jgi:hypothetical protein
MVMAKALKVSRADAYTAVADVWAMLAADAEGDIVKGWTLEMLDAVVEMEMAGCGTAMLQAGLVGIVDDGLVLPAELRNQQRDERDGAAAADQGEDKRTSRRKEQNRQAARRYRKTNRVTGSKATPSSDMAWRSLGRVAGHEVRVFQGEYGPYAMVVGATINGESTTKFTTGCKAWSLDTVRLLDALPGLVEKWKEKSRPIGLGAPPTLAPSFADFRDDAERLTMLAKLAAEEARHADDADASSRHADASATVSKTSADENADGERKSIEDSDLDASSTSADRHADALSSMSYLSTSSSSNEEDEMRDEGKAAAGDHQSEAYLAWKTKRNHERELFKVFAEALNTTVEAVEFQYRNGLPYLLGRLKAAGIDPRTGERVAAEGSHEPIDARGDNVLTTEPMTSDKPAAGSVDARGGDERKHGNRPPVVFDCSADSLRHGLQQHGVPLPRAKTLPAEDVVLASDYDKLSKVDRLRNSCGTLLAARELGADITAKALPGVAS